MQLIRGLTARTFGRAVITGTQILIEACVTLSAISAPTPYQFNVNVGVLDAAIYTVRYETALCNGDLQPGGPFLLRASTTFQVVERDSISGIPTLSQGALIILAVILATLARPKLRARR